MESSGKTAGYSLEEVEYLRAKLAKLGKAAKEDAYEHTQRFLAEASTILAASLDYQTSLSSIAQLAVPTLADWCIVDIVEVDGSFCRLAVAHTDPAKVTFVQESERRYPVHLAAPYGPAHVLRTGQSEIFTEVPGWLLDAMAHDSEHLQILQELGLGSIICVPLLARERKQTLGAITLMQAESGRRSTLSDLTLAEELGWRAALAVDNARLYLAEQQARQRADQMADRTARLQAVTADLAEALSPAQVAGVVMNQSVAALAATGGVVALLTTYDTELEVVRATGYSPELMEKWRHFSIASPIPLAEAVCTGEPVWIESREQYADRYPNPDSAMALTGNNALTAIPLVIEGRVIGAIGLSFNETRRFTEDDRAFLLALARQCAQALERGRLYEAERQARAQSEATERRAAFLAEASNLLAASLDYETTLTNVAHLVVPALADFCIIDLIEEDQPLLQVALAHVDPEKEAFLKQLPLRYPYNSTAPYGAPKVLRTGQPEFYPDLPESALALLVRYSEPAKVRKTLFPMSYLCVPLVARGHTLGAISLVRSGPERRYNKTDLIQAQEFARRAAPAVDNARLYKQAQEAIETQKELDYLKDLFVSIAGHELRTPLTTVKGYAQMLQRTLQKQHEIIFNPVTWQEASEKILFSLEAILRQTNRMNGLVCQLLDFSRLQNGRLELNYTSGVNLVEMVERVVEQQRTISETHTLVVQENNQAIRASCDEARLEQVLINLLSNSTKYSPTHTSVTVGIECRYRCGNSVEAVIWVRDEGPGIKPEHQAHIFDRFYQARTNDNAHIEGLGLGLYISNEIVSQHGGQMWVKSEPGEGSVFFFSLPLEQKAR